jgi:hypothetical protein
MGTERDGTGEEERERPRPRVVDRRVSSRPDAGPAEPAPPTETPPPPERASPPETPPAAPRAEPAPEPPREALWTPEQEAEAQRIAQEVRDTPSRDWILNASVTLANVAATKLDAGMAADAQLAIDALAALVNGVGPRLGDAEAPLRQTVAQLQMAFAQGIPPAGAQPPDAR